MKVIKELTEKKFQPKSKERNNYDFCRNVCTSI